MPLSFNNLIISPFSKSSEGSLILILGSSNNLDLISFKFILSELIL